MNYQTTSHLRTEPAHQKMQKMKQLYLITLLLLFAVTGFSQDLPDPMQPRRIVNDFTGMFSPQEQAALEQKLRNFNDSSSTQIAIATVASLDGLDKNDYAQRLGEKWGVGQKGKDNGIMILLKPKQGREKGQVAIAVGYGLEGVVPDAIASRIVNNEIIPAFKAGQYYTGIDKATGVLIGLTKGEFTADQYVEKTGGGGNWFLLLFLILFFLIPLFRNKDRGGYSPGHTASGAAPFIFLGGLGGSRNSGGFGGFSSGGGSFGGFGGGSFGGGGAGGSW